MNLTERRPSLKVRPEQFPFDPDPVEAAQRWAEKRGEKVEWDAPWCLTHNRSWYDCPCPLP